MNKIKSEGSKSVTGYYRVKNTHNQSRLAHQSVNRKKTANTNDAILLAFVLNPHAIKQAPMKDEPR
jgi:hypothetical protein